MQSAIKPDIHELSNTVESELKPYIFYKKLENYYLNGESRNKTVGDVEEELFEDIIEPGRLLFQEHIDRRGDGDVGEAVIRDDGKKLSHKRYGKKSPETIFGRVRIERMGYGYPGESGIFPLDEKIELPDSLYSYPVQQKVCREAVRSSYDEIKETLNEYTGAHVPKRQCLSIVSGSSENFEAFYEQKISDQVCDSELLVLTADGKGVVMREEGLREQTRQRVCSQKKNKRLSKGEKKNRKREALVASVYNIGARSRTADDVMSEVNREEKSEECRQRQNVKPEEKRVWASLEKEKDEIFQEIPEEGLKRNPSDKTVVYLCDGAKSVQKPAVDIPEPGFKDNCFAFIIILDLIHVIEYLWKAVYALNKKGRDAEEQVNKYLRMILEGKAGIAAAAMKRSATMKKIKGEKRKIIDKSANYILKNKKYMRYNEYLETGLPIASGVIEGACKHPVKDRFEISGARWGLEGAEALLKLRAIYQSGDWEEYWKFHIRQTQKRIYPDEHWKVSGNKNGAPKLTVIQGGKVSK